MNSINLTLKQLLLLTNLSAIIPIAAIIVGFVLANSSNSGRTVEPVIAEVKQINQFPESLPVILGDSREPLVNEALPQISTEPEEVLKVFDESIGSSSGQSFAVQVGIFINKDLAVKMAKEFQTSDTHIYSKNDSNNSRLYSVVVGLFGNKDDAKEAGLSFTKRHNQPHYVTDTYSFHHEIDFSNRVPVLALAY